MRLYPDRDQAELIEKHFRATRLVWNSFLEERTREYRENGAKTGAYRMVKGIREIKREKTWLNGVNSQSLQQAVIELDRAFSDFFRRGYGYPTFRSRKGKQHFVVPQHFRIEDGRIRIPKFAKPLKCRGMPGRLLNARRIVVTREAGRYFAYIQYSNGDGKKGRCEGAVGVATGQGHRIWTSLGETAEFRLDEGMKRKLRREERRLARKKKGSKNREKQREKLARLRQKARDARRDFDHKVTAHIAERYGTVVLGIPRTKGWWEFRRMLEYKTRERACEFVEVETQGGRDGIEKAARVLEAGMREIGQGMPEFTPAESCGPTGATRVPRRDEAGTPQLNAEDASSVKRFL